MGSGVLWAIVGGFLMGVFARSYFPLGNAYAMFFLLLACATVAFAFLEKEKYRAFVCIAVALIAFACGVIRMGSATLTGDTNLTAMVGEHITVIGEVFAEPDARDSATLLSVQASEL